MAVMKHFNYFYLFVRVLMEGAGGGGEYRVFCHEFSLYLEHTYKRLRFEWVWQLAEGIFPHFGAACQCCSLPDLLYILGPRVHAACTVRHRFALPPPWPLTRVDENAVAQVRDQKRSVAREPTHEAGDWVGSVQLVNTFRRIEIDLSEPCWSHATTRKLVQPESCIVEVWPRFW